MTDLLDQLDQPPAAAWIAEPDDKLVGRVVNLSSRDAGWGEYPIVTVAVTHATVKGEPVAVPVTLAVHGYGTVCQRELWRDGEPGRWVVAIGDEIGFKYLGKQTARSGQQFDGWNIVVRKPSIGDTLDTPVAADPQLDLFS